MKSNDIVYVKPPFNDLFTEQYVISDIQRAEDGQLVVILEGVESAFSPQYLEVVDDDFIS